MDFSLAQVAKNLLLLITVSACLVRFVGLESAPPGFFYDEATGAAHSMCYMQTGKDLFGERGIFSAVDFSGFQSAPFLWSSAAWAGLFGTDAFGFRSYVAFLGILSILGVYVLVRVVTSDRELALWAAALGACLPWSFQFSRISWDAPLGVTLLLWALVVVYWSPSQAKLRARDWLRWLVAACLFVLASYTYSPLRLQTALMLLFLPNLPWRPRLILLVVFALGNLTVLMQYTDPVFAQRADLLALTSEDPRNPFRGASTVGLVLAYGQQMMAHLSLDFLLLSGDANLRHSIPDHGVLNGLTLLGLIAGLVLMGMASLGKVRPDPRFYAYFNLVILGVFAGISPAALTWDSTPHALRAIGAWPFLAMMAAYGLRGLLVRAWASLLASAVLLVSLFFYLESYFIDYPVQAAPWFDVQIREGIARGEGYPQSYLPVVRAYYEMTEFGRSCIEVRDSMAVELDRGR